jgi:hypothetical protein
MCTRHRMVLALVVGMLGTAAQAGPFNGDFSSGFDGWMAEVTECTVCDGSDDSVTSLDPPPGIFTDNLSTASGSAVLTTSASVFAVDLFQRFVMPELAHEFAVLELSLDLGVELSDPLEFFTAQLNDTAGSLPTLSLFGGGVFDVSDYAGLDVEILFGISDFDSEPDRLRVDNIAVKVVPVPAALLLLVTGLLPLVGLKACRWPASA